MERNGDITFPIPEHVAALRRRNFHTHVNAWVDMGTVTGRNQDAVKKTVAGMLKLLHPHRAHGELTEREIGPLVGFAIEMRLRTTDQLAKMLPAEFSQVDYTFKLRRQD
ncbi:MAG: BREX system Lon protease-like protein BrxL [Isosphaeraceae bacterium]